MKTPTIKYENMRVEMARKGIGVQDIAKCLDKNRDTVGRKLARKSPLQLDEAFIIRDTFFPDCDISYLFKEAIGQDIHGITYLLCRDYTTLKSCCIGTAASHARKNRRGTASHSRKKALKQRSTVKK